MQQKNFELKVLVGGKPIHEYEHQGNHFIEGRKGSEFEVEFRNNTSKRVLAVPSVDGLSALDGKAATPESMGFVVPAHGTVRIPGWKLSAEAAAKFVFEDKERSYARRSGTQDASRAGVIGMLVYDEKVVVVPTTITPGITYPPVMPGTQPWYPPHQPFWNNGTAVPRGPYDIMRGVSTSNTLADADTQLMYGASHENTSMGATAAPQSLNASNSSVKMSKSRRINKDANKSFEMGTGFGEQTQFKTAEVTFNRGEQAAQLVVYYDSRRNLEKRGIQVVRHQRTYLEDLPTPFTSSGCTPPPGWNG